LADSYGAEPFAARPGAETSHIALSGNLIPERGVARLSYRFGSFLLKPAFIAEFAGQFQGIDDRRRSALIYRPQDPR
jgi:hypothetical protein